MKSPFYNFMYERGQLMKTLINKYKKEYFIVLLLGSVVSLLNVFGAVMFGTLMDAIVSQSVNELLRNSMIVLIVWLMYIVVDKIREDYNVSLRAKINTYIRILYSKELLNKTNNEWVKNASSDYIAKYTSNIELIDRNCVDPSTDILYSLFTFVLTFITMTLLNCSISILAVIMFIVMFYSPKIFQSKLQTKTELNAKENEKFSSVVNDCVYGRQEYVKYHFQSKFLNRIEDGSISVEKSRMQYEKLMNKSNATIGMIGFVFQIALLYLAAYLVIKGITSAGVILTIGNLAGTFNQAATYIIKDYTSMKSNMDLIPEKQDLKELSSNKKCLPIEINGLSRIGFSDYSVNYQNVSMNIEQGNAYLMLGESGCGKSTILKELFSYDMQYDGEITVNKIKRKQISCMDYIEDIAYVEQSAYIYNDTIRNNICMGKEINDERIINVMNSLCLEHFFSRCNYDLDYIIDDKGTNISGGEKQRLCIARALLSGRKVIVLDEAVSALDSKTLKDVMTYLLSMKDKTFIVCAHNINTDVEKMFDKVYSL